MYNKIHYIVPLRDDFSFTNDNSQNILYENNFVKELSTMPASSLPLGDDAKWSVVCDDCRFIGTKESRLRAIGGRGPYSLYNAPTGSSFAAR